MLKELLEMMKAVIKGGCLGFTLAILFWIILVLGGLSFLGWVMRH
jgi:hypothetical protein